MDVSAFAFDAKLDPDKDLIARVPAGLSSREALFDALSRELHFPEYFGRNWDALYECLRDFSWTRLRRVAIVHNDIPKLDTHTIVAYLSVLADAVRDWKPGEAHELVVVFPKECRDALASV